MYSKLSIILALIVSIASAEEFKAFNINYKLDGKELTNTIYIPQYADGEKLPVRGVMQNVNGPLKTFAHKNQIALIKSLDQGRGFSKELLIAAAKASERPEIEFAGAIVQGISKGGRAAADWADEHTERAIAVILDHSAIWHMNFPKRVKGVPMFFNATYADLYQNIDRRKSHFEWCTAAFKARQPCTAIVDHIKNGGHGGRGSTDLTAIWLEEAMAYRVPVNIPVGKPYKLIDVNPAKTGGYVSAKISMDGKRSYHDNVKITLKSSGANWWIPGPKTAAKYLEWVRKNGGSVEKDESAQITSFPVFIDLPANLKNTVKLIKDQRWSQANIALQRAKSSDKQITNILNRMIKENVIHHLNTVARLINSGDIYSAYQLFQTQASSYKGIDFYDEKSSQFTSHFEKEENAAKLKEGKAFHNIIERLNKMKRVQEINLAPLKSFIKTYGDSPYGKAAQKALAKLSADLSTKLPASSYFLD